MHHNVPQVLFHIRRFASRAQPRLPDLRTLSGGPCLPPIRRIAFTSGVRELGKDSRQELGNQP